MTDTTYAEKSGSDAHFALGAIGWIVRESTHMTAEQRLAAVVEQLDAWDRKRAEVDAEYGLTERATP